MFFSISRSLSSSSSGLELGICYRGRGASPGRRRQRERILPCLLMRPTGPRFSAIHAPRPAIRIELCHPLDDDDGLLQHHKLDPGRSSGTRR